MSYHPAKALNHRHGYTYGFAYGEWNHSSTLRSSQRFRSLPVQAGNQASQRKKVVTQKQQRLQAWGEKERGLPEGIAVE